MQRQTSIHFLRISNAENDIFLIKRLLLDWHYQLTPMRFAAMTTPAIALTVNNLELFYSSLIKSASPFIAADWRADGAAKAVEEVGYPSVSEGGVANSYQWFHYRLLESQH